MANILLKKAKMSPLVRRRLKLININKKRRGFELLKIIVTTVKLIYFIFISGAYIQNI